jgi:beta-glucanase (GH16 family)
VNTARKKEFQYGRLEVKAKIPTAGGSWPAIWTLGKSMPWPSNGEIDVMEYYRIGGIPHILANAAWGDDRPNHAIWDAKRTPFEHFLKKDPQWAEKFHVWRFDWDKKHLAIYLDDEILNYVPIETIRNGKIGEGKNPFHQPHYLLLNLALGGDNGGKIDDSAFPMRYYIDYVRLYQ